MNNHLPPIYFYIPHHKWPQGEMPNELPEHPDQFWPWIKAACSDSYIATGKYAWTLQTYLYLKAAGFPCEITATVPAEGIILAHRNLLSDNLKPGSRSIIVCMQADKNRHPYAQLHVVQNRQQEGINKLLSLWVNYFIPVWPQGGIIPRDSARGDRFENIGFFGRSYINLAPELRQTWWKLQLSNLGLNFHIVSDPNRWNDYSNVDLVLAVRSFRSRASYCWKPASKLFNAWLADVPAILGCESAYRSERKNELDYIEVTSPKKLILALKHLRDDKDLRQAMVANGRLRAKEIKPDKLTARWCNFITDIAVPAYENWCNLSRSEQQIRLKYSASIYRLHNLRHRTQFFQERVDRAVRKKLPIFT